MAKKATVTESNDTIFNVRDIHLERIKKLIDAGHDTVVIHGDGSMFAGKEAITGSEHHIEYNSGVPTINKDEPIARNAFRAIYKKGDVLPETAQEVIKEFYNNQNKDLQKAHQPKVGGEGFNGAIKV